jgi:hypothetical protein
VGSCRQAPAATPSRRFIVVFDLNGMFCQCSRREPGMVTVPTWITYDKAPDKPPALVGPKVVLPRLGYKVFWGRMSSMFHVCIWSSMKKSTVDLVVEYLFAGGPKPAIVLGQEDCTLFKDMWNNVVMNPMKPEAPLFLKSLLNKFWWPPISFDYGRITAAPSNTILVDDCPYKSVCNPDECGIFPNPFTSNRVQDADMTKVLLPYFQSLFYSPMSDARDFVVSRRFGQQPIRHNDAVKVAVLKSNGLEGPDLEIVEKLQIDQIDVAKK